MQGGDAAALEIIKSKYALKQVEQGHDELANKFQHGFQHVALKGFVADAARSVGVGGELRPVLRMVSLGLDQVAESAGLAGTAMGLLGTGFLAVAALGFVIHEHFAKHEEDLAATLKGYNDNVTAVNEYVEAGGRLSKALQEELRLTKEKEAETVKDIQAKNEAKKAKDQESLAITKAVLAQSVEVDQMGASVLLHKQYEDRVKLLTDSLTHLEAELEANRAGFATSAEYVKSGTAALTEAAKATKDLEDEQEKAAVAADTHAMAQGAAADKRFKDYGDATDKIARKESELQQKVKLLADEEAEATGTAQQRKEAAIDKYRDAHQRALDEIRSAALNEAGSTGASVAEINYQHEQASLQLSRTVAAKRKENYSEIQLAAISAEEHAVKGFSDSAAKMLVEGKNLKDALSALSKQIAEEIISDLIRIMIQAELTKLAVGGIFGPAVPGAPPGGIRT